MNFNGTIEMNSVRRDADYSSGNIKEKSPIVEIFSYMAAGKDVSELDGKLKDSKGNTALSLAELYGNAETVEMLKATL